MLNINYQSIKRKQHLVQNVIASTIPDIVIGTETWLDSTIKNDEIFPDGYKIYRKDRKNQVSGGVMMAIKNDIISDEVEDLTPDSKCEIIWAKIEIKGTRRASQIKNAALLIGGDFNLPGWD